MSQLLNYWQVPDEIARQIQENELPNDEAIELLGPLTEEEDGHELDRAHGILHFLLTGTNDEDGSPLSSAIFGKVVIDDEEGFSYSSPENVKSTAKALCSLDHTVLKQRFEPQKMREAGVYDSHHIGDDDCELYLGLVEELTDFYRETGERGMGLLVSLC